MTKPKRGNPTHWTVPNIEGLAGLVRHEIRTRFGGSVNAAAKSKGMSQSTLNRLVTGRTKRLRQKTVDEAFQLLPKEAQYTREIFIEPVALLQFRRWTQRYRRLLIEVGTARSHPFNAVRSELVALLHRLSRDCSRQYARLVALGGGKHSPDRVNVAILRILTPLVQGPASRFIEKSWTEMDNRELGAYLEAAIRAEAALLKRSPDASRALEPEHVMTERQKAHQQGVEKELSTAARGAASIQALFRTDSEGA